MTPEELVDAVTDYYLRSDDWNGLPAHVLLAGSPMTVADVKSLLRPLLERESLSVNFGDIHPNPHIRALPDPPLEHQLRVLNASVDDRFVMYPTAATLINYVNPLSYAGRPFSLRLARGAPQLGFASFDLTVIDQYRRDPRYHWWTNDIQATLSIGNEAYESDQFPAKHKILIQTLGFSYNSGLKRAVAVFLTDLDRLTPEHQQRWATFELEGDYKLHPDFARATIFGDWDVKASLRDAFVEELRAINAMCMAAGWPPLFRNAYAEPPVELAFLIRPTVREFNEFVHTLDKLISENINIAFFPDSISREIEETRDDGKIIVKSRGSLALLEDWLRKSFHTTDWTPLKETFTTFRKVRKLRQHPAHTINQDAYDEELFEKQRLLFGDAYDAIRTLRLTLQNHPRAQSVADRMNENVRDGNIWNY